MNSYFERVTRGFVVEVKPPKERKREKKRERERYHPKVIDEHLILCERNGVCVRVVSACE